MTSSSLEKPPATPESGEERNKRAWDLEVQLELTRRFADRRGGDLEKETMFWVDTGKGNYARRFREIIDTNEDLAARLADPESAEQYDLALAEVERLLYGDEEQTT